DMIGAGVKTRRHMGVVKDLQLTCILRKGFLQKQQLAAGGAGRPALPPGPPNVSQQTPAELLAAAKTEQGAKLKALLIEAEKRQLLDVLLTAAGRPETEAKQLGETYLAKHLAGTTADQLKHLLKHPKVEARAAAAHAIATRQLPLAKELIDALADESLVVRQAARGALVRLAGGQDFGPAPDADDLERAEAIRRWRSWHAKQTGHH
ncbi:MAG: hypothetical protein NZO58_14160, partial [Gemmataceae bacterium]|nr:hypothetical protein [Gemmataceae bacterium]